MSFMVELVHAWVARLLCVYSVPVPPTTSAPHQHLAHLLSTHHEAYSRTLELVSQLLVTLYSVLNQRHRYTNDDDSYIFAPAEPTGARPLVVHRHSGDIVLDREFFYTRV